MSFMKAYTQVLTEGGNVEVDGKQAVKLDMSKISADDFKEFKGLFIKALIDINKKYEKMHGNPLWKDVKSLAANGKIFSGSTRAFFTKDYETFKKFKPLVGDMDVQVPEPKMKLLRDLLDANKGKKFGAFTWKGFEHNGLQYNGILVPPAKFLDASDAVQLDFEGTPFGDDEIPTEFAEFGHYSSWTDIKANVKGLFIKYLMRCLTSAIKREKIAIVSKTGKRTAKSKRADLQSFYSFSVDRGFRLKLEPVLDDNDNIVMTDGLPTYKEVPTKDADYKQDLDQIFSILFGKMPTPIEKRSMFSFIKTLDLMNDNLSKKQIEDAHDTFVGLLWGKGMQGIERNNPAADAEIKNAAYDQLVNKFSYLKGKEKQVKQMYDEYYKKYRMTK